MIRLVRSALLLLTAALAPSCSSTPLADGAAGTGGVGAAGASAGASGSATAGSAGIAGSAAGSAGSDAGMCFGISHEPSTGQNCGCVDDCDLDEVCVDEASTGFPSGFCARNCTNLGCPTGASCITLTPSDPSTATCVLDCQVSADCPQGQICQNQTTGGALFCFPLCQSDADCPTLGSCDRYSGFCGAPDPMAGSGEIGVACAADADCRSQFCLPPSTLTPDGACTAFCSMSKQGCPAGSTCTRNWSITGDEGICFRNCSTQSDCRPGYTCGSYPDTPGRKVCAPN